LVTRELRLGLRLRLRRKLPSPAAMVPAALPAGASSPTINALCAYLSGRSVQSDPNRCVPRVESPSVIQVSLGTEIEHRVLILYAVVCR
jgi:hypothetical protein